MHFRFIFIIHSLELINVRAAKILFLLFHKTIATIEQIHYECEPYNNIQEKQWINILNVFCIFFLHWTYYNL